MADETVTEETSANEITAPEISISPVDEISDNVTYVQDGIISFTWHSDGDLSGYRAEILDANGNVLTSVDTESEGASLDSNNLTAEAIYTIRVTAIPADGTAEDGVASEAYFAKHETVSEEAEEQVEDTASEEVTEDASEETTAEEAAEETTTETTAEDTAESTEESASEPTEEPVEETTIGSVSAPTVEISPNVGQQDSVTYVESGTLTLSWYADGEVASYRIEILESDTVLATLDTTDTSTNLSTGNMVAGTAYVLRVTAIPTGGTIDNGVSTELLFALVNTVTTETESEEDAAETTEDAADETTVEEASEPAEEPAAEPTEEPAAEQAEEPAAEEETVEEPVEESTDEQTDETVTDEEKWQTPIDETSDPELITELQQRLVDLGWLEAETYTIGTLDEATITAVLNFQNNYNLNYGGTLELIDSELPVIQVETLTLLMLTTE